jgi:hypothetical protein
VGDFLRRLASPREQDAIKSVRTEVREEARRLLRHYPSFVDFMNEDSFDADEAERYGLKWYAKRSRATKA